MRTGRKKPLIIGAVAVAALGVASAAEFAPRLVWNASASAPIGLYSVSQERFERGDFVIVAPTPRVQALIDERSYLPPATPLLKRVAARSGARICRNEDNISIDGAVVAHALRRDSKGRNLPVWSGCKILEADEIFLLNDHAQSLDGRYFGATKTAFVIGIARPLWTRGERN
ncbi:S26 family signal peptidase [Marinicaulis aureus]|uniref:S26 family signal peptidase n=1 Tax=Hyphococcus aureus TaxID=2666033 RepID=A0ABW1L326_9PROT